MPNPSPIVPLADSRKGRVYIAGPMTGIEEYNFPAFHAAAAHLAAEGYTPVNPADHGLVEGAKWADYMRYDIAQLATCEAIYFLPGWSASRGARVEHSLAEALGMEILFAYGAEYDAEPGLVMPTHTEDEHADLGPDLRAQLRNLITHTEAGPNSLQMLIDLGLLADPDMDRLAAVIQTYMPKPNTAGAQSTNDQQRFNQRLARRLLELASRMAPMRREGTALSPDLSVLELDLRELAHLVGQDRPTQEKWLTDPANASFGPLLTLPLPRLHTAWMPRHPSAAVLTQFSQLVGMEPLPENPEDGYPITGSQSTIFQWYQKLFAVLAADHDARLRAEPGHLQDPEKSIERIIKSCKRVVSLHGWLIQTIERQEPGEKTAQRMRQRDAALARFRDRVTDTLRVRFNGSEQPPEDPSTESP